MKTFFFGIACYGLGIFLCSLQFMHHPIIVGIIAGIIMGFGSSIVENNK